MEIDDLHRDLVRIDSTQCKDLGWQGEFHRRLSLLLWHRPLHKHTQYLYDLLQLVSLWSEAQKRVVLLPCLWALYPFVTKGITQIFSGVPLLVGGLAQFSAYEISPARCKCEPISSWAWDLVIRTIRPCKWLSKEKGVTEIGGGELPLRNLIFSSWSRHIKNTQ